MATSPARESSLTQLVRYSATPQQVAVQLDDDSCGFCYYESGRVAVCVNKVSDYQRTFQFYADHAARTLLATFDEHAVGSATRPRGTTLLLTKDGGLLLDANDQLTKSWRWDRKAQHAGTLPSEPVVIPLNDALLFTYTDRHDITIKFAPSPGISVVFQCGEQLRRRDTYLDHVSRSVLGGKLTLSQPDVPTLQQRQKQIETEAIEKRSRAKPRSHDLSHEQIKAIVSGLETAFDAYEGCRVTPAADGDWKAWARRQSLSEIPRLPPTGTEVGTPPTLLGAPVEPHDGLTSRQRLQHPETGEWLGSVELLERIRTEHPSLPRKGALSIASGRYMRELPVSGYVNGRKPAKTARLTLLSAAKLDALVSEYATSDVLIVVACLRTDDPQSCAMERLLEQIQQRLHEYASEPPASPAAAIGAKCKLLKCDLAESSLLADRFRIHATPTFLIFYHAKLAQVSSLGGSTQRVFPATSNAQLSAHADALPRVLLVEMVVKHQVATEKILRKEAFSWDLALGGDQAVAFLTRLPSKASGAIGSTMAGGDSLYSGTSVTLAGQPLSSSHYGLVLVSDTLEDAELRAIDRLVRSKDKQSRGGALVCAVVSSPRTDVHFSTSMCVACRRAQGRRIRAESATATPKAESPPQACPHCGVISVHSSAMLVSSVLAEVAHVLVYKHIKAATLHRLTEAWVARSRPMPSAGKPHGDERFTGLTVDSFFSEMERHYAAAKRGVAVPESQIPDMALSVVDAVLPATTASLGTTYPTTRSTNVVVNLTRSTSA